MKDLILKVKPVEGSGIQSLGFDIVWNDENVVFEDYEQLGGFDTTHCALQDGENGRLIIAASMINDEIIEETEVVKILFGFKDGVETDISFSAGNISAKNAEGHDVNINMNVEGYYIPAGTWDVDWMWINWNE